MINNQQLINFLDKAKKATFASTTTKPIKTKDKGLKYIYKEDYLEYNDKYYGYYTDTGQEIVWNKRIPIWSMSYRGGMLCHKELSNQCFSFLKQCLKKFPKEFPVRGPKKYKKEEFVYVNEWKGNLNSFFGEEKIFWKGKQIYFRNYLGGIID